MVAKIQIWEDDETVFADHPLLLVCILKNSLKIFHEEVNFPEM